MSIAFNDSLGWTHTLNPIDVCDLYLLSPAATSLDAGYTFDGQIRAFETVTQTIKIARPDGSLRVEPFVIRRAGIHRCAELICEIVGSAVTSVEIVSATGAG